MLACEEIELFGRICMRRKVAYVPKALMLRNEGGHNLTSNHEKLSRYTILALQKILKREPQMPETSRQGIERELGKQHWWRGYAHFNAGRMADARDSFRSAVRHDPSYRRSCVRPYLLSYLPQPLVGFLRTARSPLAS
ncbi:MAG: hypothetical protein NVSMB3_14920 [Acidobacteriaceae bacterium]